MAESDLPVGYTTPAERTQAEAQLRQLVRVDRQGDVIVQRYADSIKRAALAALRSGKKLELPDSAIESAINELVGLSVLAYLTGAKNNQPDGLVLSLARKSKPTKFDRSIKRIAKNFNVDVGKLSKKLYNTVAPNMRDSLHSVKKEINKALAELSGNQTPVKQGVKVITAKLESMGVAPKNGSYVQTLIRTHSQMAYNAAQYDELQADDSIWGYTYVTMLDDRVRPAHAKLEGLTKKKDNSIWSKIWPPNGWNCRCQVVPVYKGDVQLETRLPPNAPSLVDPAFRFNPGLELV
jgi:SPP1 gp7 family putative phage head morphogenesis protein